MSLDHPRAVLLMLYARPPLEDVRLGCRGLSEVLVSGRVHWRVTSHLLSPRSVRFYLFGLTFVELISSFLLPDRNGPQ